MVSLLLALGIAVQLPDSARQARFERVLREVTDSLDALRGAAAGFRADLSRTSAVLVLERAARVRNGCRAADAALARQQSLLSEGIYRAAAEQEQARLAGEVARLRQALVRCQREWAVGDHAGPAEADSLRAWGPYRTAQLDSAVRRFVLSMYAFMKKAELKPAAP